MTACSFFLFIILITSPIVSTATIGQMLASESIPNPSMADTALPSPSPIASTNGTVTGPVVTPALSQATLTNSSVEKIVKLYPKGTEAINLHQIKA